MIYLDIGCACGSRSILELEHVRFGWPLTHNRCYRPWSKCETNSALYWACRRTKLWRNQMSYKVWSFIRHLEGRKWLANRTQVDKPKRLGCYKYTFIFSLEVTSNPPTELDNDTFTTQFKRHLSLSNWALLTCP